MQPQERHATMTSTSALGRFTILEKLGEGGMGEVYRAHDPELRRDVAIKVLKAEFEQDANRVLKEARAVARLNHANIVTVYEVCAEGNRKFLVMEFMDGVPLHRWSGEWKQILPQIADGLAAAHEAGITHRDLKPGNVLVNKSGVAKIVDFGLAACIDLDGATRTVEGVVGTYGYMAPEQFDAKSADSRADIYAFGAMLYEHLTGELPWKGANAALLSEAWRPIVTKCLEIDPARRYASILDVKADLARVDQPQQRSVAVLPFVDRSSALDQAHICDGIAEEIIHGMSRVEGLHVAARSSSFRFRGESCDLKEVARTLNVEAVLEGSVRRSGNRFRVSAQLVECATGFPHWSERYDRESEDLFALQDDVAASVVRALQLQFQRAPVTAPAPSVYEDILKIRHLLRAGKPGSDSFLSEIVPRLLRNQPDNPSIHLLACGAALLSGIYDQTSTSKQLPLLESCARRAIELAPELPDGYLVLASVRVNGEFDIEGGRALIQHADSLVGDGSPPMVEAAYHTRFAVGDIAGAERTFLGALVKEPHNIQIYIGLAQCAFLRGDMAGMAAEAARGLALEPGNEVLGMLAAMAAALQHGDRAALDKLRAIWQQTQVADFGAHYSFALFQLGLAAEIEPIFEWARQKAATDRINSLPMARLCCYTGRQREALTWLKRAIDERSTMLYLIPYLRMEAILDEPDAAAELASLPKLWWPDAEKPWFGR